MSQTESDFEPQRHPAAKFQKLATLQEYAHEALLDKLVQAVGDIKVQLYSDGVCQSPFSLFYNDSNNNNKAYRIDFPTGKDSNELLELMSHCQVAPFGKGKETVVDENYRNALKMDIENFSSQFERSHLSAVASQIEKKLCADKENGNLRIEPYKMNIYQTGGFFKKHQDTPRSVNMFGSLVVCLPTVFQGGDLVLYKDETPFYKTNWGSEDPKLIQWVAFYSDCCHEVLPVTSGHRVTLTYNLYWDDLDQTLFSSSAKLIPAHVHTPGSNQFTKLLQDTLNSRKFMENGAKIGFGLIQKYVVDESTTGTQIIANLKASDLIVYSALKEIGLNPEIKAAHEIRFYEEDQVENHERFKDEIYRPHSQVVQHDYSISYWVLCDKFVLGELDVDQEASIEDVMKSEYDAKYEPVTWLSAPVESKVLSSSYMAYGNNHSLEHIYVSLVMVCDVSDSSERQ